MPNSVEHQPPKPTGKIKSINVIDELAAGDSPGTSNSNLFSCYGTPSFSRNSSATGHGPWMFPVVRAREVFYNVCSDYGLLSKASIIANTPCTSGDPTPVRDGTSSTDCPAHHSSYVDIDVDAPDVTHRGSLKKQAAKKMKPLENHNKKYNDSSLYTVLEEMKQRKVLDLRRWYCISRPQYKTSCGISSLVSCWNYLFSTCGTGSLPPITQEEALHILGFQQPFEDIRFGPFTGNATLMRWFRQLNEHFHMRGCSYVLYKPHGKNRTAGETAEGALMKLTQGLKDESMAFIYHCQNHYFCPIGFEATPLKASKAFRGKLPLDEMEFWILIGEPSKKHPAIHCKKWADIVLDLNTQNPEYLDIRNPEKGIQYRKTKKVGGNLHCIIAFQKLNWQKLSTWMMSIGNFRCETRSKVSDCKSSKSALCLERVLNDHEPSVNDSGVFQQASEWKQVTGPYDYRDGGSPESDTEEENELCKGKETLTEPPSFSRTFHRRRGHLQFEADRLQLGRQTAINNGHLRPAVHPPSPDTVTDTDTARHKHPTITTSQLRLTGGAPLNVFRRLLPDCGLPVMVGPRSRQSALPVASCAEHPPKSSRPDGNITLAGGVRDLHRERIRPCARIRVNLISIMGVKGLWKLLECTGQPINPETLEGKILAVDISIWLNQAVKGARDRHGNSVPNAHLLILLHRLCKLLFYRIRPVIVFDGKTPLLKKQTLTNRWQRKELAVKDTKKTTDKLLRTILKQHALKNVLGKSDGVIPSLSQVRRGETDDIFILPSLEKKDENSSDEEAEKEWEERMSNENLFQNAFLENPHSIDIESKDFANLPPEVRHEILTDLKEFTKRRRSLLQIMPEESTDFSQYQLTGLLKRNRINQHIEGAQKEMSKEYCGQIQMECNNEGGFTKDMETRRLVSEDASHYILIKGIQSTNSKDTEMNLQNTTLDRNSAAADIMSNTGLEPCNDLGSPSPLTARASTTPSGIAALPPSPRTVLAIQAAMLESSSDEEIDLGQVNSSSPSACGSSLYSTNIAVTNLNSSAKNHHANQQDLQGNEMADNMKKDSETEYDGTKNQRVRTHSANDEHVDEEINVDENELLEKSDNAQTIQKKPIRPGIVQSCEVQEIFPVEDPSSTIGSVSAAERNVNVAAVGTAEGINEKQKSNELDFQFPDILKEREDHVEIHSLENDGGIILNSKQHIDPLGGADLQDSETDNREILKRDLPSSSEVTTSIQHVGSVNLTSYTQLKGDLDLKSFISLAKENQGSGEETDHQEMFTKSEGGSDSEGSFIEVVIDINKVDFQSELFPPDIFTPLMPANESTSTFKGNEMLRLFGIPYIVAPMEAEAQCAYLDLTDQTGGTITDDSDIWLFGARHVYKHFFSQDKDVEYYQYIHIHNQLGLDRTKLINLAYFLGSDYTEGIPGVGYVTAMELLNEFLGPGLEPLFQIRDWWTETQKNKKLRDNPNDTKVKRKLRHLDISPGFPNPAVAEEYLKPVVDESKVSLSWGKPDLDEIREFCENRFGWTRKKTDEVLLPVMKQVNAHQSQLRIDSFFRMEQHEKQAIKSQRLRRAVTCMLRKEQKALMESQGSTGMVEAAGDSAVEGKSQQGASGVKGRSHNSQVLRGKRKSPEQPSGGGFIQSTSLSKMSDDSERDEVKPKHSKVMNLHKKTPEKGKTAKMGSSSSDESDDHIMVTARPVFEKRGKGKTKQRKKLRT
ncbi:DNA excision repair protein ERCC-5 [Chiloscyllium plagiosum]|uniref:DNA excision repair protein ERCC-5 n=1 Tax=Chiloscyllium plagiosum TaxID=36176 RepID=UPI001CB88418|nr:DNA excision repair protein ERCC-5 [Chiloscyllium plagiosum]